MSTRSKRSYSSEIVSIGIIVFFMINNKHVPTLKVKYMYTMLKSFYSACMCEQPSYM